MNWYQAKDRVEFSTPLAVWARTHEQATPKPKTVRHKLFGIGVVSQQFAFQYPGFTLVRVEFPDERLNGAYDVRFLESVDGQMPDIIDLDATAKGTLTGKNGKSGN